MLNNLNIGARQGNLQRRAACTIERASGNYTYPTRKEFEKPINDQIGTKTRGHHVSKVSKKDTQESRKDRCEERNEIGRRIKTKGNQEEGELGWAPTWRGTPCGLGHRTFSGLSA
jgi:hypothetical protein